MELMYPHPVDRFRLIQRLVASARAAYRPSRPSIDQCGISQEALARRAMVSQATVSNIENLEKTIDAPNRRVRREDLLRVLTWGLEMAPEDIDALLWLFDGDPLRDDEIRRYVRGYQPRASRQRYTVDQLRQRVLDLVRSAIDRALGPERSWNATVRVFTGDDRGRVAANQALRELDQLPGHRLLATALPPSIRLLQFLNLHGYEDPKPILDTGIMESSTYSISDRLNTFLYGVQRYGERGIHSRRSLEEYLSPNTPHRLSLEQRRAHIRSWCDVLRKHRHYQVALADETPDLEPVIKSTKKAMLRASRRDLTTRSQSMPQSCWGPQYILWLDEISVISLLLDFETRWNRIPVEYRTKDSVLAWLEERLGP
jgi:transcriptional regulator with XRE-family HTH domain